ncbi:four helix bundle protein [Idiomarina seosinensis]|uniref:Four helix bundle protein n=1 Tax=Idiomarina seosinensis TaxID=281739 RepID=A0A432ZGL4_9GAMM|nr:four helix bundle protein [Idiomarina seosinensis]RUO77044.1 four helix bundle protein [Idiomarina seosinensis]
MNYHKLWVWRESLALAVVIMKDVSSCKHYFFKDQVGRSALSVPSNIAEAMVRDTAADRRRILYYAIGSSAELETQLKIGKDLNWVIHPDISKWLNTNTRIQISLHNLVKNLQQSR